MAESLPHPSREKSPHIFDLVPNLDFELQLEARRAVASVSEKLQLLSNRAPSNLLVH
jgi:hypothetical protein